MKKLFIGLFTLTSFLTFASESKVICEVNTDSSLTSARIDLNDEIKSLQKKGFTKVSAPALVTKGQSIAICVTISKE